MSDNTPQLPCVLSRGVLATREGLMVDQDDAPDAWSMVTEWDGASPKYPGLEGPWILPWDYAAERLRYREGEPYCETLSDNWPGIHCGTGYTREIAQTMNRLAVILCDDSDAFRALHWCIHKLGENEIQEVPSLNIIEKKTHDLQEGGAGSTKRKEGRKAVIKGYQPEKSTIDRANPPNQK